MAGFPESHRDRSIKEIEVTKDWSGGMFVPAQLVAFRGPLCRSCAGERILRCIFPFCALIVVI
jgi:hypothetical protein